MVTTRESMAASAQRLLLWSVYIGLALVLLTPLMIAETLLFPFVVGKALYSRTVIAVLLCLWTALALLQPSFRPPGSKLLVCLGASLAAHAVGGLFGVSPVRSVWSTYERMQGLVDFAHWFAYFLVAVSVLREPKNVRALLNVNLGVALVIGCLAAVGYFLEEVPLYNVRERDAPRVGSVFGNATYLGAYAATNMLVAAGFLTRSFFAATSPSSGDARAAATARHRAQRKSDSIDTALARIFWGAATLGSLLALMSSGSVTAFLAVAGGVGFLVVATACFARSRAIRRLALAVGMLGGMGSLATGGVFFFPGAFPAITEASFAQPLTRRLVDGDENVPSFLKRRLAWGAGIDGFLEKPILGWGPENYIVVFGRYVAGIGPKTEIHDYAHNKFLEEATTKGLLGLVSHLALWICAFYAIWRAARRSPPAERVFALFIGAALTAYFVQQQALVDTLTLSLQFMLLLAFATSAETVGREGKSRRRVAAFANLSAWWRRVDFLAPGTTLGRLARGACGCGVLALAGASVATSHAIHAATAALTGSGPVRSTAERPLANVEQSIVEFEPMANWARLTLMHGLSGRWRDMRMGRSAEAKRLLASAEREGALALAAEPENWQIHATLSRLYCAAARTEPDYLSRAREEHAKALALAPQLDSFLPHNLIMPKICTTATTPRTQPPG